MCQSGRLYPNSQGCRKAYEHRQCRAAAFGLVWARRPAFCMEEAPSTSGVGGPSGRPEVKLFLGGLSWDTTEDKLREYFGRYGEIADVTIMTDRLTGRPRGFGFLTFVDEQAAERVCFETHFLDGRQIDAKRSVPQEQKPKSKKIFVGGLAPDTTDEQFKVYFEQFGEVSDAQIMQDHNTGRSRGFGFVTYEDDTSVDRVFDAGPMHDLAGKKVEVKPATPRGSGPQGRGAGPPDRGQAWGYRAPPPTAGRGYPSPYGPGNPSAQPGFSGYGTGLQGVQYNPGQVVNPYYQLSYPYGGFMLGQMGPYGAYSGFGFPAQYPGSAQQLQLTGPAQVSPMGTPAAFDRQPQTPPAPSGMGAFGPGPGPGLGPSGPGRFQPGRHGPRG